MGEELINHGIYFKDEDGNFNKLSSINGLELSKIEPKIESENKENCNFLPFKNEILTASVKIKNNDFNFYYLKKILGYSNLKSKRFKKLLMSIGFSRNEAEEINNFFKYNSVPRYEYYIQEYSEKIELIKKILKSL